MCVRRGDAALGQAATSRYQEATEPCCMPPSSTPRHLEVALALRGLGFFDVGRRFFALFALLSLLLPSSLSVLVPHRTEHLARAHPLAAAHQPRSSRPLPLSLHLLRPICAVHSRARRPVPKPVVCSLPRKFAWRVAYSTHPHLFNAYHQLTAPVEPSLFVCLVRY